MILGERRRTFRLPSVSQYLIDFQCRDSFAFDAEIRLGHTRLSFQHTLRCPHDHRHWKNTRFTVLKTVNDSESLAGIVDRDTADDRLRKTCGVYFEPRDTS